ncbi:MAG: DUF4836 family protein, partial [Saprospiraceae bacterium]|nr:DUF4836 family protein [Saprospiraceae bacterium]
TTYFFIPLKDSKSFASLFEKQKDQITEKEGISILNDGSDAIVAWNGSLAIFAVTNVKSEEFESKVVASFKPNTDNPLLKDASLQKALSSNHDISSWLSTNQLAKNSGAAFALNLIDVKSEALKDNFIQSYADFEDGRLVGHSDFIINEKLGKDFVGRFFKDEAEADFSKVLPKEKLTFATVMALDLVGIDKFLSERPQSKDYADFVLNDLGVKRKDIIDALGGDMMIAGFGGKTMHDSNIQLSLSLKNEEKAKELLQYAVQKGKLKEKEPGVYSLISIGNEDFSIKVNKGMGKLLLKDGMLTFVSNDAIFDKIKMGETGGEYGAALQNFDNQTIAGWFDFQSIWNAAGGDKTNSFKQMNFKVNGKGADFILETAEPNTNSLKAFFEMINEAYKQNGKMPEEAL